MTHKQLIKNILDTLAKEHGTETFVSDAYGYYEDAEKLFEQLLFLVERQALTLAWAVVDSRIPFRNSSDDRAELREAILNATTSNGVKQDE